MSRLLYDLGVRLRAAHEGRPISTATYAPALPPSAAVAVTVEHTRTGKPHLIATDGNTHAESTGTHPLAALDDLGVYRSPTHRTLVTHDARTLGLLAHLARAHHSAPCAPVIDWWDQRADYPGSGAVHLAIPTARLRWTLPVAPQDEDDLTTWLDALCVPGQNPDALLALARATTAGTTLPGLIEHYADADTRSWAHLLRTSTRRLWYAPDTTTQAALGLLSREHAVELYASLRLDDPLVATAAAHDGTLVTGDVERADADTLVLRAHRPLSRLRTGSTVTGWAGHPRHATTTAAVTGRITATTIDTTGTLRITVGETTRRPTGLTPGQAVTLRPARTSPHAQSHNLRLMRQRIERKSNWITGRGTRRTAANSAVPLDVIVAAADE